MEVSVKLANMEKHFNDILTLINENQNIKRYLKHLSDDPLYNSPEQPDIQDSLINDNIVLSFFSEKILTENKAFLFFNLLETDLSSDTVGKETYIFDIIVPASKWILRGLGQFRVIRIAMELCQMLDQQNITGISDVKIKRGRCFKVNDEFMGMTLTAEVGTSNVKLNKLRR